MKMFDIVCVMVVGMANVDAITVSGSVRVVRWVAAEVRVVIATGVEVW